MYFADTHVQDLWAFDYDIEEGVISNRRVFKDWTRQIGRPDGATTDSQGCIWTCMVASGQLVRMTPRGDVDQVFQLPVTNPTCPTFGGDQLESLYIAARSQRLSPKVQATELLAGALLAIDPKVVGLPEARYAG